MGAGHSWSERHRHLDGGLASYCWEGPCGRADYDAFRETGGVVRFLIVTCEYQYLPKYVLTSIRDGCNMQRIAQKAGVSDITFMRDDLPTDDPLFPTAVHLREQIRAIGERSGEEDYFVFFYSGHADSVDSKVMKPFALTRRFQDEDDGKDEVFQLPGPNREFAWKYFLVDDDFAEILDTSFDKGVRILVITDCCHSGTIADVDTHNWGDRRICAFAACRDSEESTDTGRGGVLSKAIDYAVRELAFTKGKKEYSLGKIWSKVVKYAHHLETDQEPQLTFANMDPESSAWPMPQAWWRNFPGTTAFKVQQEIERMRRDRRTSTVEGVRTMQMWEEAVDAEEKQGGPGWAARTEVDEELSEGSPG